MYEVYQDHPKQTRLNIRVVLAVVFLVCAIGAGIFLITRLVSKPLTKEDARGQTGIVYDSSAIEGGWDNLSPEPAKINLSIAITKYMHANYHKNISVQDIADTFYISPRHVNRVFEDYFGQSFKRTLNIYRLNYAKNYLLDTDYSTEKIAALVGLSSPKMLYQLFREIEGMTLGEFRAQYGKRSTEK